MSTLRAIDYYRIMFSPDRSSIKQHSIPNNCSRKKTCGCYEKRENSEISHIMWDTYLKVRGYFISKLGNKNASKKESMLKDCDM